MKSESAKDFYKEEVIRRAISGCVMVVDKKIGMDITNADNTTYDCPTDKPMDLFDDKLNKYNNERE